MTKDQPYSTCGGIVPIAPIHVYIDAEYFRPKFEEILNKSFNEIPWVRSYIDEENFNKILNNLIECLKNPEGK